MHFVCWKLRSSVKQPLSIILISFSRFLERENYLINGLKWISFECETFRFYSNTFIYIEHTTSTKRTESLHFNFPNCYLLDCLYFQNFPGYVTCNEFDFECKSFSLVTMESTTFDWTSQIAILNSEFSLSHSLAFSLLVHFEELTSLSIKKKETLHHFTNYNYKQI